MSGVEVATMIRSIVAGVAAGRLERLLRRVQRQIAARDPVVGEVARADAGALDDPFVARSRRRAPPSGRARSSLVTRRGGR